VKHVPTVLALCALGLAALALGAAGDPEAVRPLVTWSARLTLLLFVVAFVALGHPGLMGARPVSCRAAAFVMALHLLSLIRFAQLAGTPPLAFGTPMQAVSSLGGAAAAAVVVVGWACWRQAWYRWAVYWPWVVFLFTYVVLPPRGASSARVFAEPLAFLPVVVLLLAVLLWRVALDFRAMRRGGSLPAA
jgi:hypothetical protein